MRPRLGLALGSGSARGWAHIGVVRALEEFGLRPQVVVGASVGALVAAAHASARLDALESWVCTLTQREVWRLVDTRFRGGGVMTGNRLMDEIARHVGDPHIEELGLRFAAVATDLHTGEEVWIREGPVMAAVRASSGVPGLFTPTWYLDRWLIDGGVVNPLPVSVCRALGADVIIAVDLGRSLSQGDPAALRQTTPSLLEAMASAVNIMQDSITRSRLVIEPADLVLRPDVNHFQLMDFHRAAEAIEIGRRHVRDHSAQLEPILALLREPA
ncbi:MAG: patatin [Gammaproteobacteria bacterium]|nr:patatin [Gammaproteobacteria bacterium]